MYIVNPLKPKGQKLSDLSSTHPPISERVRILRSISGGANYVDYQNAFNKVKRGTQNVIPSSGLADHTKIVLKEIGTTSVPLGLNKQTKRDAGDIMMKVNKFAFINCECGLKIKIPPGFSQKDFSCPRCGRKHSLQN
jgi:heat shock protein HtpX